MLPIEKAEYLDRLGLSERDFTEQLNAPDLGKIIKVISIPFPCGMREGAL